MKEFVLIPLLLLLIVSCSSENPIEYQKEEGKISKISTIPSLSHWNVEYDRGGSVEDDMDFTLTSAPDETKITIEAYGDDRIHHTSYNTSFNAIEIDPDFIPRYYWVKVKEAGVWHNIAEGYCNEENSYLRDTHDTHSNYKSKIHSVKNSFTISSCTANFWIKVLQPDRYHLKITAKKQLGQTLTIVDQDYNFSGTWARIKQINASYMFAEAGTYTITYQLTSKYYSWNGSQRTWPNYTTTTTRTLTVVSNCAD